MNKIDIAKKVALIEGLSNELVSHVKEHEIYRLSQSEPNCKYHAFGDKSAITKTPLQADIVKLRRELLELSKLLEVWQ